MSLEIVPIKLDDASLFVGEHHRHHDAVCGHKFSIAVADETGEIRGVVMVGRPTSRVLDNGWTLEVKRCCTDGTPNACSMLYRAAWRASRAMGYRKLITYIVKGENGASLRGAGFRVVGERGGGTWHTPSRPRVDHAPTQTKLLYELV
jgi:hypothetical protein